MNTDADEVPVLQHIELFERVLERGPYPEWVHHFTGRKFFKSCSIHRLLGKEYCNRYCITCDEPSCKNCMIDGRHNGHKILQIYQHFYGVVVRLDKMQNHMDCEDIQRYPWNKKWAVYLTPPQKGSGPVIEGDGACGFCRMKLSSQERYPFCSIACMVKAISATKDIVQPRATEVGTSERKEEGDQTRKISYRQGYWQYIPTDIVLYVFSHLPVAALLRFMSVCRSWHDMLVQQLFLNVNPKRPRNEGLIVHTVSSDRFFLIKLKSNEHTRVQLDWPYSHHRFDVDFLVSYKGIVGVGCQDRGDILLIWNVATRSIKAFDVFGKDTTSWSYYRDWCCQFGIGYNPKGDAFILVRITCWEYWTTTVSVYSTSENDWKIIDLDFLFIPRNPRKTITVNGDPYWIAETYKRYPNDNEWIICDNRESLVWFDVKDEEIKSVPLPDLQLKDGEKYVLMEWNNFPGVVVYDNTRGIISSVRMFIFFHDKSIWSKAFEIGPIPLKVRTLQEFSKDGRSIVGELPNLDLFVYNLDTEAVTVITMDRVRGFKERSHVCWYEETLALACWDEMRKVGELDE